MSSLAERASLQSSTRDPLLGLLAMEGVGDERIDADDVRIRHPIWYDGEPLLGDADIFIGERLGDELLVGERVGDELSDAFASRLTSMTADEGRAKGRDNGDEVSTPLPLII